MISCKFVKLIILFFDFLFIDGIATVDLPTSASSVEVTAPDGKMVSHTINHGVAEFKVSQIGAYNVKTLSSSGNIISTKNINVFDTKQVKVLSVGDAYCHRPAVISGMYSVNYILSFLL